MERSSAISGDGGGGSCNTLAKIRLCDRCITCIKLARSKERLSTFRATLRDASHNTF
jgi:hypothetical protein